MRYNFERQPRRPLPEPSRVADHARRRFLVAGLVFLVTFVLFPAITLGIYLVMTWARGMNRLDDAGIARAVADLGSNNPAVKQAAVKRLLNAPPQPDRREVAAALKPLLHEGGFVDRKNVLDALAGWGNAEDATAVAELLKDEGHGIRWPALKTLGELKGKAAAEVLVRHLARLQDRAITVDALRHVGPAAEPALIAGVTDADPVVREMACEVLGSLGTRQCVDALEKASADPQPRVAQAAQAALQVVRQRR